MYTSKLIDLLHRKLRDWALELDQKAVTSKEQTFSSRMDDSVQQNDGDDDDDNSQLTISNYNNSENESKLTETSMHMRNQCDVLLHRLDSLIHPNVYNEDKGNSPETADRNSTFCPILLPINDLNYPQCCDAVCDIDKVRCVVCSTLLLNKITNLNCTMEYLLNTMLLS